MDYARHEVAMQRPMEDGGTTRAHLLRGTQSRLARTRAVAEKSLEGPPYPDTLGYLYDWALELHGRSGVGVSGVNPLSWEGLDAWARRTDRHPAPHEVQVLMQLDAILCTPAERKKEKEPQAPRRRREH